MLKYNDLQYIEIKEYSDYIKNSIQKETLFALNAEQIVYECLKLTNYRKLKPEKNSVEYYCRKTLNALTGQLKLGKTNDAIELYLLLIFNFDSLPIENKIQLEHEVKKDLSQVSTLIKFYEEDNFIKNVITKKLSPRSQLQRTKLNFYKRTVAKKEAILNYWFTKLEDRALEKAERVYSEALSDNPHWQKVFQSMNDFPYREIIWNKNYVHQIDLEKLDYRLINPLKHKHLVFPFKSPIDRGYSRDSDKEVHQRLKGLERLKKLHEKLIELPVIKTRSTIFSELIELYKKKLWYGFYALGLPQVEGMFSEMLRIASPKSSQSGSLSDKAGALRTHIDSADLAFDYFEYYLPDQRNKFAHSGNDDDIIIKCKYLILDLEFIIHSVFNDLKSSLIDLHIIIQTGITYFVNIGHYAKLLKLIHDLKSNGHYDEIAIKLEKFVYKSMQTEIDFKELFIKLDYDFNFALNDFSEKLNLILITSNLNKVELWEVPNKNLITRIPDVQKAFDHGLFLLIREQFYVLNSIMTFVSKFTLCFPDLNAEIHEEFKRFTFKYEKQLEKIKIMETKLKIEQEDVPLISPNWKHVLK